MSDVINNRADHRFELTVDGYLAAAYYKLDGDVITFVHTEVPSELGGKGVGSKLVKGAFDQVRTDVLRVIAHVPSPKPTLASTSNIRICWNRSHGRCPRQQDTKPLRARR